MGKADDPYTPAQRAAIKKMLRSYTPEERAALQKKPAGDTPEQRARLDKGRAAIDRYIALRDHQIPAEKPRQPAIAEAKPLRKTEPLPRRKPGPRPKKDWPTHVRKKLRSLKRSGKPIPTAAKFCQLCEDELGYQPDIREMQRLLSELRA